MAEKTYDQEGTDSARSSYHKAQADFSFALKLEESYWKQKANIKWTKDGDANTNFFHQSLLEKRNQQRIEQIKNDEGELLSSPNEIASHAVSFFSTQLAASPNSEIDDILQTIPPLISAEQNLLLSEDVTMQEVKNAVFQLDESSAPRADGFSGSFYRKCWDIISSDLLNATRDFFLGTPLPKGLGSTLISLIPKQKTPKTFKDFRPISLCTFANKVFTKVLANRLIRILPNIITIN